MRVQVGNFWRCWLEYVLILSADVLDDYFGEEERPGFEGRPGMQERLGYMESEIACISYEMRPNSGSSIKDAINRIEERLDKLERN